MSSLYWRRNAHIPVLIVLEVVFIVLFGIFAVYHPENAVHAEGNAERAVEALNLYPMFQDVHVMIFIGFGFLMTFLKKYGLSAVSLNMLCAVISLQWATLVIGFFHLHKSGGGGPGVIYIDLYDSMLLSDFASAAVLISFGAVIGTTTPLQLIVMTLIEIVLFTVNEVIGRKYLGAIDAGDSIFVHAFGAYFGLAVSRMLYTKHSECHENQGSGYTSDLFSMVGTIFLWLFWPSFNSAAALTGSAQHRAVVNTYFSLCASVMSAFAFSALCNEHNKFVMEHIQNATLAGGVAIGAVADLMVQPFGALIIGTIAGAISVCGYEYFTPWLKRNLKVHDTCGVHNLHGVPAILATVISILMAGIAQKDSYGEGLYDIYPARANSTDDYGNAVLAVTAGEQAKNQFLAGLVTMAIALVGGAITGALLKVIGEWQAVASMYRPGSTVVKLVLNVGNIMSSLYTTGEPMPKDAYFNDDMFFEVNSDDKTMIVTDHSGKQARYDRRGSIMPMQMPAAPGTVGSEAGSESTATSTFTINEKPV